MHRIGRVWDAELQVVNGHIYRATLEVGKINCLIKSAQLPEPCHVFVSTQRCHVEIRTFPLKEHKAELTQLQCEPEVKIGH